MRYKVLLVFILLGRISYGQLAYKLSALVPEELNGAKVYLNVRNDKPAVYLIKDSTNVKNNQFHFSGKFDWPSYYAEMRVVLKSKQYFYKFALDSGLNTLNLRFKPGSQRLNNAAPAISESNIIHNKMENITSQMAAKHPQGSIEFHNDLRVSLLELLKQYPNNFYSLFRLKSVSSMGATPSWDSLILKTLDTFSKSLQRSPLGLKLREEKSESIRAAYSSRTRHKVHLFNVRKANGGNFSNKTLLGQPYVIVFSATWCIPCQRNLPFFDKSL